MKNPEAALEDFKFSIGKMGKSGTLFDLDKLNDINLDDMDDNQQEYLIELVDFLLMWLVNHILKMDKKIPSK